MVDKPEQQRSGEPHSGDTPLINNLAFNPKESLAAILIAQQSFVGQRQDVGKPSQQQIVERERQRLLDQQRGAQPGPEMLGICTDVLKQGNFQNGTSDRLSSFMQNWHGQNGSSLQRSLGLVQNMNAEFDRSAAQGAPGSPHYHLAAKSSGNNIHIELTDRNVPLLAPDLRGQSFQTQQQRNDFARGLVADRINKSLKDTLDFNIALTPEASKAIKDQAALVAADTKKTGVLKGEMLDRAFELAIKSRPAGDPQAREVMQTVITAVNNELRGSGLSITPVNRINSGHSRDLAEYLSTHPNAQAMTLSKEGRTVQEYAYDPTNLIKPDVAEPARISDAVVDRISRFGAFADPTSATNRRIEHQQAVDRFQNATDLNAVVEEMNAKLKASHYHLKITQSSPYRPIQIDIVDDMGRPRLGEFIQIQPRRK